MEAWRDRFHRAMYQLLLAGPVLAGAYNAPFWAAKRAGNERFLSHCVRGSAELDPMLVDDEDGDFARTFPVYNYDVEDFTPVGRWRERAYECIFGPFARWLVDEGNAREEKYPEHEPKRTYPEDDSSHLDEVKSNRGAVQDLMCLLVGHEHLICKFTNANSDDGYGFARWAIPKDKLAKEWKTRKVTVVLFGVFRVEEVTMPSNIENTKHILLPTAIHPSLKGTDQAAFDMLCVIHFLDIRSRGPGDRCEHPDPPAMFQLWLFALRKYLKLGFRSGSFWQWRECMWWEEVGSGVVFHEPRWAIVQPYVEGEVSWLFRGFGDDEG
ncbi:hypothetical protein ONS95_012882 [Cadophora gregata]|uniref:uncharacterized protein n=1 Tax=Cadophora gregata TaxID=51156 RepID=UPI0026DBC931|nr:uncharacterized protein ONS95_012882 [Cadophora gregata]KAK0101136.1 hypothetical protein ONS96_006361 [Cadophora gregata f. sp. sojae]KAK0115831.1 hypothetical protein ONS95_012882 [Cadophora gregata]